jgi:hypothetical protein
MESLSKENSRLARSVKEEDEQVRQLSAQLDELRRSKVSLEAQLEAESEYIANTLNKKLQAAQADKAAIEAKVSIPPPPAVGETALGIEVEAWHERATHRLGAALERTEAAAALQIQVAEEALLDASAALKQVGATIGPNDALNEAHERLRSALVHLKSPGPRGDDRRGDTPSAAPSWRSGSVSDMRSASPSMSDTGVSRGSADDLAGQVMHLSKERDGLLADRFLLEQRLADERTRVESLTSRLASLASEAETGSERALHTAVEGGARAITTAPSAPTPVRRTSHHRIHTLAHPGGGAGEWAPGDGRRRSSSLDIGLSFETDPHTWSPPQSSTLFEMEARPTHAGPRDMESALAAASAAAGIGRVSSKASLSSLNVPPPPSSDSDRTPHHTGSDRIRSSFSSHEQLHAHGTPRGRPRSQSSASNAQSELARAAAAEAAILRAAAAVTGSGAHEHFTRTLADDEEELEGGGRGEDAQEGQPPTPEPPSPPRGQHTWLMSIRDALRRGSAPPLPMRHPRS